MKLIEPVVYVEEYDGMFYGCESLINLNMLNWDTASVLKTKEMFKNCNNLQCVIVGEDWDMSNVLGSAGDKGTNMFVGCKKLVGINISSTRIVRNLTIDELAEKCDFQFLTFLILKLT